MDPDAVEADMNLGDLPATVLENIICELSKDEAWQKVAKYLEEVISDECLHSMMSDPSPERKLLDILMHKYSLKVGVLQKILENCQLYDILRNINTSEPAEILDPKEDSTYSVPLGAEVSLPVVVCGSPFPDIQWHFKGSPLIGKTSPELVLGNLSIKDVGEYTCKIKQRLNGSVSELTSPKYILHAEDTAPRISVDLKGVEIKAHEDLILSFEVTGYPEPKCFKWFKNNMAISKTDLPRLIIQAADVHNSGEYYCETSSRAGRCETRKALVKVKEPVICPEKPEIIEQPRANQEYYVGHWMYLACEVLCSQQVKFTCFLNNEEIKDNTNACVTTSSSSNHHWCGLKYRLTKEQMVKENWKQLNFKFEITSANVKILSDDVKVEVKTTDVKKNLTARNKWALLIGNSHYPQMDELPAARRDINVMKENFTELRFRVLMLSDLRRTAIQNAVKLFSTFIQKGDYVAFYYAGHGIHDDGKDYIIPLDATLKCVSRKQNVPCDEPDISIDECISYVWITNVLQRHEPALIFSIYDMCRQIKPKFEGGQSHSSQDRYQTASKNSFFIFATSENYATYEPEDKGPSLLVDTLQSLLTCKISVQELSCAVLNNFHFPGKWEDRQVPKICGDLALPLSLADPSRPHESDKSESGVLKRWEQLASGRGRMQESIPMADTKVEASIFWNIEPQKDGVTWVISNSLPLTLNLSQDASSEIQEMDVQIMLWNGKKESLKLKGSLSLQFPVSHLQDLKNLLLIELCFTYKGHQYKKKMHLESPAISQKFFKGNYID